MNQTQYLESLIESISNHVQLAQADIITPQFKQLQRFHHQLLWEKSIECCSIYYENIFSHFHDNPDLIKASITLLNNKNVPLPFFEYLFKKYPYFVINKEQEKIIEYPIDYFPVLFSRTLLSPQKTTQCLYNLFMTVENNIDKINFIIENQKNKFIPFHEDMYYFVLFSAYMQFNSEKRRTSYCINTKSFICRPSIINKEFILTANIIYQNFNNIFDFIKPKLHKQIYQSSSFSNRIQNENDFAYFIDYISALLQKEKIESKLSHLPKKNKLSKI